MFVPKERVLKYGRKTLTIELQGEIGETTISVGDFNTLVSENVQFQWQNSKDIVEFNIISQLDYNGTSSSRKVYDSSQAHKLEHSPRSITFVP